MPNFVSVRTFAVWMLVAGTLLNACATQSTKVLTRHKAPDGSHVLMDKDKPVERIAAHGPVQILLQDETTITGENARLLEEPWEDYAQRFHLQLAALPHAIRLPENGDSIRLYYLNMDSGKYLIFESVEGAKLVVRHPETGRTGRVAFAQISRVETPEGGRVPLERIEEAMMMGVLPVRRRFVGWKSEEGLSQIPLEDVDRITWLESKKIGTVVFFTALGVGALVIWMFQTEPWELDLQLGED